LSRPTGETIPSPEVLNDERLIDRQSDQYPHVWEGAYATAVSGSYFGDLLAGARREGRIGELHIDPMLEVRAFFDIGVVMSRHGCILPHDGVNKNVITGKRYEDHLSDAGFKTQVIPNAGVGAARMRIEAVRRILPRCHFDEKKCEAGLEALAWYHERTDEHREVGLGPLHD
jgi:phage terminase large subunit